MCFMKRYEFIQVAHTDMHCYTLRRHRWSNIMQEYPVFRSIVKQKSFSFYVSEIQRPMLNFKKKDIDKYDERTDYLQVLATNKDYFNEISACVNQIYKEADLSINKESQLIVEQSKIIWLT